MTNCWSQTHGIRREIPTRREPAHARERHHGALRRTRHPFLPKPQRSGRRRRRGDHHRGGRPGGGRHADQGGHGVTRRGRAPVGLRHASGLRRRGPGASSARPRAVGRPAPVAIMGRTENPVLRPTSALGRLACYLRRCKARAGLTNKTLAFRTKYSATTLQRASSGAVLPTLRVVLAYEEACGLAGGEARVLWQKARRAEGRRDQRRAAPGRPGKAPRADLIADRADMSHALADLRDRAGLSYRAMERRVEERPELVQLSRSTAQRILTRQAFPTSQSQLMAVLHACAVPKRSWDDWSRAWKKVHRAQDRKEPAVTPARKLLAREAEAELACFELEAVEPFRSPTAAWSVRCCLCGALFRVQLSGLGHGWTGCPNRCPRDHARLTTTGQLAPSTCPRCELQTTDTLVADCPVRDASACMYSRFRPPE
ncbi:helix-turn-helix domain-containing protein [Streptomyces sp. TR1341]|nr:helix-turn-helix domain-containing protein [Streptomyces sp. TR1341]